MTSSRSPGKITFVESILLLLALGTAAGHAVKLVHEATAAGLLGLLLGLLLGVAAGHALKLVHEATATAAGAGLLGLLLGVELLGFLLGVELLALGALGLVALATAGELVEQIHGGCS